MPLNYLDTSAYLISTTNAAKQEYQALRQAEDDWIQSIGHKIDESARCIVVVDSKKIKPSKLYNKLLKIEEKYIETISDLVNTQGKSTTVGNRRTAPITWTTPSGPTNLRTPWPDGSVIKITKRKTRAWRGAPITPTEAIRYLKSKITRMERHLANSEKNAQYERAETQSKRLTKTLDELDTLKAIIERQKNRDLAVRLNSGNRITYGLKTNTGSYWSTSVGRIQLIYADRTLPTLKLSTYTQRKRPEKLIEIEQIGELYIYAKPTEERYKGLITE